MTLVTLRPTSTIANSMAITGAASLHAALADNSDTSYAEASGAAIGGAVAFGSPSLPGGAVVKAQSLRVSTAKTGATAQLRFDALGPGAFVLVPIGSTSPVTYVLVALPSPMADPPVTGLNITATAVPAPPMRIYAAYLDVLYVAQPGLTVDEPSASPVLTTEPTVSWTPNLDHDGGSQTGWTLRVFSAAQYTAGGFNPATSPATFERTVVGTVIGRGGSETLRGEWTSYTLAEGLLDGTYRAYVQISQTVNGNQHWSGWAYKQFTVVAVKPLAPSITATPDPDEARIRIDLDNHTGVVPADYLLLQRSTDDGQTWEPVRSLEPGGRVEATASTVYDYELGNGIPALYRARAANDTDSPPVVLVGEWAMTSAPVTWSSMDWWLKCPELPELNAIVKPYSMPSRQRAARQTAMQILGTSTPIVVSDVRGGWTGTLQLQIDDRSDQDAVDDLLDAAAVLLLQGPPAHDEPDRYLRFGDQDRARWVDKATSKTRIDSFPWVEVDAPAGTVDGWPETGS